MPFLRTKVICSVQAKRDELKFMHVFPLCFLHVLFNGYLIILKYFSSFTGKNVLFLTKCRFTKFAKVLYRKYNEMPHEVTSRLYRAEPIAEQMIGINQKNVLYHLMKVIKIITAGCCLVIIPLAFITKFTLFGISSSFLLMVAIPTVALLYSQTTKKVVPLTPKQLGMALEKFTCHEDKRWNYPYFEKTILSQFESSIFRSNIMQCLSEVLAPFFISSFLDNNIFSFDSPVIELVISNSTSSRQKLVRNSTVSQTLCGLTNFLNMI
ncbi:hypothetical protein EIN_223890 [Entamoeba invadens IP1]|uniref:Autophagy-related protein 9 n=1 Tax=Entamoeba invadens IP1 TaxID=370355 RepID=A0A0A1U267_ENTIV|nr:hypothetical protein EIN_223890 [Entamoeba invadens IP1]ELP88166.1 hypothetical protein EIN_223890 [Entamoeba invadens IP1]|eukprot:XP_004254937.1 hypothetical protein EIN_223890 [Entamoeba invadens IP1]